MSDSDDFIKAYDAHADAIFRFCYYRVYDYAHAKDLTQETFTKTWEYIIQGKKVDNIKAFLYQVARNLIIDNSRKKQTISLDELLDDGFQLAEDNRYDIHTAIDATRAQEILNDLDEKYREPVFLRYVEGFQPREIARIMGESENVVSVRIHRGLKQLREIMKKWQL